MSGGAIAAGGQCRRSAESLQSAAALTLPSRLASGLRLRPSQSSATVTAFSRSSPTPSACKYKCLAQCMLATTSACQEELPEGQRRPLERRQSHRPRRPAGRRRPPCCARIFQHHYAVIPTPPASCLLLLAAAHHSLLCDLVHGTDAQGMCGGGARRAAQQSAAAAAPLLRQAGSGGRSVGCGGGGTLMHTLVAGPLLAFPW